VVCVAAVKVPPWLLHPTESTGHNSKVLSLCSYFLWT